MMSSAYHVFYLASIKYNSSKEKFINTPIQRLVYQKYSNSLQINILGSNFNPPKSVLEITARNKLSINSFLCLKKPFFFF